MKRNPWKQTSQPGLKRHLAKVSQQNEINRNGKDKPRPVLCCLQAAATKWAKTWPRSRAGPVNSLWVPCAFGFHGHPPRSQPPSSWLWVWGQEAESSCRPPCSQPGWQQWDGPCLLAARPRAPPHGLRGWVPANLSLPLSSHWVTKGYWPLASGVWHTGRTLALKSCQGVALRPDHPGGTRMMQWIRQEYPVSIRSVPSWPLAMISVFWPTRLTWAKPEMPDIHWLRPAWWLSPSSTWSSFLWGIFLCVWETESRGKQLV